MVVFLNLNEVGRNVVDEFAENPPFPMSLGDPQSPNEIRPASIRTHGAWTRSRAAPAANDADKTLTDLLPLHKLSAHRPGVPARENNAVQVVGVVVFECTRYWLQRVRVTGYNVYALLVTTCTRYWLQRVRVTGYNV